VLCRGNSVLPAGFAVTPRWISGSELLVRHSRGEQYLTRLWFIGHGLLKAERHSPSRASQPPDLSAAPRPITETGSCARPTRRGNRGVLVTHYAYRPLRMWPSQRQTGGWDTPAEVGGHGTGIDAPPHDASVKCGLRRSLPAAVLRVSLSRHSQQDCAGRKINGTCTRFTDLQVFHSNNAKGFENPSTQWALVNGQD
jgi:hypothetical protein